MRKVLSILFLFSIGIAYADEKIEVPALFKDSSITTTLKNGKQFTFDGNKYMVVLRKAKPSLEDKSSVSIDKKELVRLQENQQKLNRVRLMGGIGPTGFKSDANASSVDITSKRGAIGGLGYDRMLNKNMSVGGQALSNGTLLLGAGLDF
jgi:hypothetical protein